MSPLTTTLNGTDSMAGVHAELHNAADAAINALQAIVPPTLTSGQLLVGSGTATLTQDAGLAWDNTTKTLTATKIVGTLQTASTGATATTRYVGGTASGAPTTGTFNVGDFVVAQDAAVWICTVAGAPGTWAQVGPPPAPPLGPDGRLLNTWLATAHNTDGSLKLLTSSPAGPVITGFLTTTGAAPGSLTWPINATASTPSNPNGIVVISDVSASAGNGGTILFAGSGEWFAGIKGFVSDGSANSVGDLAFATRNTSTDTTLTERLRLTSTGAIRIIAPRPFAAGDHYLVIDANGDIHKSAIGPAS